MRFFIVLAVIGGCVYFAYTTLVDGSSTRGFVGGGIDKLAGVTKSSLDPNSKKSPLPIPVGSPVVNSPVVDGTSQDSPKAMQIVTYKHREPPAPETVTIANSVGCALTLDSISRSLVVVGPVLGVDIVKRYLESIDQPAGMCAVKSWAVYVDKSAQSGFDLVAAIRAVASSSVEATVGDSGLTLDLNADKLSGALAVVCDGSVVEVIQRPQVQLFHGVAAKIESIEEVPIPSTAVSQGVAQTSIEFRKVGLQLDVTPYFLAGDGLRLNVVQTNGLLGQLVKIGENEVPVIQSQTVSSTVQLNIGQTVVLGGVTTYRNRIVRGILTNKTERTEGSLYVILSTYYDVPKAVPVDSIGNPSDSNDSKDWISDQILPFKGWQHEERELIRSKASN